MSTAATPTPENIRAWVSDALQAIAAASSSVELKQIFGEHLSDKSPIALANRGIGALEPELRKEAGKLIGGARTEISEALTSKQTAIAAVELEARLIDERIDVTLPVSLHPKGAMHPITSTMNQLSDIFVAMGWEVVEGPELESEWFNFDALNLGPDHPARALQDTLWIEPVSDSKVMRTATSPVQIHSLLTRELPVYIVSPGKVYRADELDATHLPVFHQIEGLVVDKGITMAHLRGTLDKFAKILFGDVKTRFRPHYFPFTEPSAELDVECFVCHGESVGNPENPCRTCSSEGWIEWGGCGVVNPRVLIACGIDPDEYTGFAFGMGIDRTVMFRHSAPTLRDFVEGDIRFTRSMLGEAR